MDEIEDPIQKFLGTISERREQIKEEYAKAWLATLIPDHNLDRDWLIANVQLVERWSKDHTKVAWNLEMKPNLTDQVAELTEKLEEARAEIERHRLVCNESKPCTCNELPENFPKKCSACMERVLS